MSADIKRVRMIAGPNGSGKSTLIELLQDKIPFGIYVNADDIEAALKKKPAIHFNDYSVITNVKKINSFIQKKTTIGSEVFKGLITKSIFVENNILVVNPAIINSYTASLIADFIRHQVLKNGASFSFETVMSHQSKINFLNAANKQGYKTYLYFVSTNNPEINYQRV